MLSVFKHNKNGGLEETTWISLAKDGPTPLHAHYLTLTQAISMV